ncbi:MAG: hypothetical protein HKN50_00930 [Gammaproteobacteria bacterium]|nr:hypothetical protein [Gammaproteobacteria bacterium]
MVRKAPIVVIVFNRPHHARQLRRLLDEQQGRELYLIADGARDNIPGETRLVQESVDAFADWRGGVKSNIATTNLGCKQRIASGLDWVFEHCECAIILEDDLQPAAQFFDYCDELLAAFENNHEVKSICGSKLFPQRGSSSSVFYSKYGNSWGWATWRRAWVEYDDTFADRSSFARLRAIATHLNSVKAALYWHIMIRWVWEGRRDSWDYCWMVACFLNRGVHVYPASNLIVNSGFGLDSTHTAEHEPYMPLEFGERLSLPLDLSPGVVESDEQIDAWIDDNIYSKSAPVRLRWLSRKIAAKFKAG